MITMTQLKAENYAHESDVMARRSKSKCLSCGRRLLENTVASYEPVEIAEAGGTVGRAERRIVKLARTWGYKGTGICTLRCGFRWAQQKLALRHGV